ncbi:putative uncharacterized protein DDB_G0271982 [Mytilus californianus]|uniref:putative uncharacterized protein DDB_G0271982 n=1 Tax=Mytilus californianus TaxID=6549 RepID=UPI0022476BA1|nr:putative uncharacterized protein DDB_G0271982 [Mytilus californianus]
MVFGDGGEKKKKEVKKVQEKKRTPEEERERKEKREEKKRRKEEKEVEKESKKGKEDETEKKKEEKEKKKEERASKKEDEKIKENRKESVQKQKEVLSNLWKEMENSSVGSLEEVSLCDPEEDAFLDNIVGFTSAVEPISPLPSDPCKTSPNPDMPYTDIPVITVPDIDTAIPNIDVSVVELPSLEPPLTSTSLCIPLATQPCPTYSPTQELLSPSELRKAAAIYTPTPVKKLKLEQIQKSQQTRFFINVGGTRFETSATVFQSCPESILSAMIKEDSPVKPYIFDGRHTYFLDRDAKHSPLILNYLRNQARTHSEMLPRVFGPLSSHRLHFDHGQGVESFLMFH